MTKYIFRLDDICLTMNWQKFERMKTLFFEYGVKPTVAVIPDNKDDKLNIDQPNANFWSKINELHSQRWTIAMHGYQHKYTQKNGGILKIHTKSEFAGLPYQEQFEKIKKGKEILESHGIKTGIFIAPGHSFDKNTLRALKENNFNALSDGIALYPFKKYDILWIPQIAWQPRKFKCGIITFCLHPNTMEENDFCNLENFVKNNASKITDLHYAINYFNNRSFFEKISAPIVNFLFRKFWYLKFHLKI